MELLFNELSITPLSVDSTSTDKKVLCFVDTIKAAKKKGFRKIRSDIRLEQILLADGVSFRDWILQSDNRNYRDLLFGIFIHPFLNLDEEEAFNKYDAAKYTFQNTEYKVPVSPCLGLAAASIYELPAISFSGFPLWENPTLIISIDINGNIANEEVLNVAKDERFEDTDLQMFFENYGDLVLPETDIEPANKKYNPGSHHGIAELTALCKQLIHSPYVIEMHSMEWCKGKCNNFIKNFYKDGVVEIVLTKTQRRYGLWIQTTGKNHRQTKAISEILEEKYS
jgi:hypothetical protein